MGADVLWIPDDYTEQCYQNYNYVRVIRAIIIYRIIIIIYTESNIILSCPVEAHWLAVRGASTAGGPRERERAAHPSRSLRPQTRVGCTATWTNPASHK